MPPVTMPQLGESVEEGTIGKWLKQVGDHVRVGDPLVEVVTDKVNAEVPSPFEGTLTKIHVAEGETVGNDAVIAEVEASEVAVDADEAAAEADARTDAARVAAAADSSATAEPDAPAASDSEPGPDAPAGPAEAPAVAATAAPAAAPTTVAASVATVATPAVTGGNGQSAPHPGGGRMTPAVRRLARERGVDVSTIVGTGIGGRITRADVEKAPPGAGAAAAANAATASASNAAPAKAQPASASAAPAPPAPAASPVADGDSLKRLSPMRKAIAAQMTRFLEVPTAYITIEVDMTPVVRARAAANAAYKAQEGVSLSYVAYVTKACVEALRKHHDINAHWTEEGHWRRKDINVGIAVAVTDGLIVPVIRNADALSLHGLNMAINDFATRARSKKIMPDELKGGTFTVDNTGWTGSVLTLPIINVPEVAIITMEKIVKRPVVLEDQGDAIAVRSMMNMCIAIDHRATDGAQAGEFLADVRHWLESVDADTPIY